MAYREVTPRVRDDAFCCLRWSGRQPPGVPAIDSALSEACVFTDLILSATANVSLILIVFMPASG